MHGRRRRECNVIVEFWRPKENGIIPESRKVELQNTDLPQSYDEFLKVLEEKLKSDEKVRNSLGTGTTPLELTVSPVIRLNIQKIVSMTSHLYD
jgi:hypothetical protein